jgi:lysophospholipase L1-like esterase
VGRERDTIASAPRAPRTSATRVRLPHLPRLDRRALSLAPPVLLASAAWLYAVAIASNAVLPPLRSSDGRLEHVIATTRSLSQNHARLIDRVAESWGELELAVRPEPGEAVSVIVRRRGERASVLRVSRFDALASGVIELESGRAVAHATPPEVSAALEDASSIRLVARDGAVRASFGAAGPSLTIPAVTGEVEVVLFPPASPELYERVTLTRAVALDGREIPTPPWMWGSWFDVPALAACVALAALAGRRRLARAVERLFPGALPERPLAAVVALVLVNALALGWVALGHFQILRDFTADERAVFRAFVTGSMVLALALAAWLHRRARAADAGVAPRAPRLRAAARLGAAVSVTLAAIVLSAFAFSRWVVRARGVEVPSAPGARAAPATPDPELVAIYGGSSTRGYPFPGTWRASYPAVLEALLHARGLGAARVLNLAFDSAVVADIVTAMERDLPRLRPARVVIDAVCNDWLSRSRDYRANLGRALAVARAHGATLTLVKEPMLLAVYGRGDFRFNANEGANYAVLTSFASENGVELVDPAPLLIAHRDEFLFMDDVHLTARGHEVMAEALAAALAPALAAGAADGAPP